MHEDKQMTCHGICNHCDMTGCKSRKHEPEPIIINPVPELILDSALDNLIEDLETGGYTARRKEEGRH